LDLLDTNKEIGDVDHLKVFATAELADILFDALIVISPRLQPTSSLRRR
jgi:hypothetical protein